MHELSLAIHTVEIAEEKAKEKGAVEIEEMELEIGCLAGIELQTFTFALESAVKGTMLENARIIRREIPGEGICGECGKRFGMSHILDSCPSCGSFLINIVKGKEFRIKTIVINGLK